MNNVILNIRDYLPHISSAQDQSITRLIGNLEKRKGFNRIELLNEPAKPMALSIHHDNSIITSQQITQIAELIASKLNDVFEHLLVKVADIYQQYKSNELVLFFKQCAGVTHVLSRPNGWIDLEFNRYVTEKARRANCNINQNR